MNPKALGLLKPRSALRQYQRDNNLAVTGDLDRNLARYIRDSTRRQADQQPTTPPISTARLAEIERNLSARGYRVGVVDGQDDANTKAALQAYQSDRGVPITGEPPGLSLPHSLAKASSNP